MKILVTGGAGYIGSHICKELKKNSFIPVVFDNLSNGYKSFVKWGPFVKGDLKVKQNLKKLNKFKFSGAIHLASNIEVEESHKNPEKFYLNNILGGLNLLEYLNKRNIKNLVFSGSASVYGSPKKNPIFENFLLSPISPYGNTKLFFEKILVDYFNTYNFNFVSFRYFNAAGADKDLDIGESHRPETHLIPRVIESCEKSKPIFVYGKNYKTRDGTCIRDYIHVSDLASAHVKAIKKILKSKKKFNYFINLGSGKGFSVLNIIKQVEKFRKRKIIVKFIKKRPGDPPILRSDIKKAKSVLNWTPKNSNLKNIIETAYKWYLKKRQFS